METSEYLSMFLAEGREHLQELNLAVVRIEERPDDRETVEGIFRIAHSLKGMSATMGFAGMAALTHQMEDVFELLRQRRGGLSRIAVDVLLECLDALAAAIDAIDETGEERIRPAPLIERLRDLVRERTPAQEVERAGADPGDLAAWAAGSRVVRVCARLVDDAPMPSVRAHMILAALSELGETVACLPTPDDVETFAGREVVAFLVSERPDADLADAAASVPDVASVVTSEALAEAAAAPATPEPAVAQSAHKPSPTVRVDAERLDQLMQLIGELVLHRTRVEALAADAGIPGLPEAMQKLACSSHALHAMVMQVRMSPVEAVFLRFPRLVRDLSARLGKQVDLQLVGKDIELDRTVVDALGDPLVHLVRNALDHGLEPPEERVAAGKPDTGTLEISARRAGGDVVIAVRDDGRGIDPLRVARSAAARGLIAEEAIDSIDAARAAELLFQPGFSTAEATSDISGRGVGMDVVRTTVRALGGEALLSSELGRGTAARLRLPLTPAIVAALLVEADGAPFAVPIDRIERTVRLADHAVRSVAGAPMLVMTDGVLPIVDASARLGSGRPGGAGGDHAVIVRAASGRLVLAVSRLVGECELVTRPLPAGLGDASALSGAAVLSDGRIALIVDCDAVAAGVPVSPLPTAA